MYRCQVRPVTRSRHAGAPLEDALPCTKMGSILARGSISAPFEHCQIQQVSGAGLHQESHREALDQIGYLSEALPGCRTPLLPPTVLVRCGRFCLPPPLCPSRLFAPRYLPPSPFMQLAELSLLSPN